MSELRTAKLGEVATLRAGFGFPEELQGRSSGDLPFAKVGDISRVGRSGKPLLVSADHFVDRTDLVRLGAKPVPKGSVLFAKIGEAISKNHRVIAGREMLIDNNAMAAIPGESLAGSYLYHFLKTVDFYRLASATTVPALRKSELERLTVPLPPLPEQRRIAEVLDRAEALRARRRASIDHLVTLRHSLFDSLGSRHRSHVGLEEVTTRITDGTHLTPQFKPSGIPFIFVKNVRNGRIDFSTNKFITEAEHATLYARCPVEAGDILYTTVGATYGHAAMVGSFTRFAFQRHIAHIKPDTSKVVPKYLEAVMQLPVVKRQADRWARGAAQPTINLTELREFRIPLPKRHVQEAFATQLDKIDGIEATITASLAHLDTLFASLQHRAFCGEL